MSVIQKIIRQIDMVFILVPAFLEPGTIFLYWKVKTQGLANNV